MPKLIQSLCLRIPFVLLVVFFLIFSSAGAAGTNPLVGKWEPAANQPSEKVAREVEKLGQMEITTTHLTVFGESPVAYEYEQDGRTFHIKVNEPNATPFDFVLKDPDTLLMRLPDMEILWHRMASAAPKQPAAEAPAAAGSGDLSLAAMPFEMMSMMMPHSKPTRYEALDESLEMLLNDGWSIIQASGAGSAMALVLRRGQQNVICILAGNLQDRQGGVSDCRRIN